MYICKEWWDHVVLEQTESTTSWEEFKQSNAYTFTISTGMCLGVLKTVGPTQSVDIMREEDLLPPRDK